MIMLMSFVACLYLPWWSIAIVSFLMAIFISQKPLFSFLSGFIGIFILWGVLAFWISAKNDHILAHKVSLIILKTDSPILLVLVTAIIGAIIAGLAALCGAYLRSLMFKDTKSSIIADI